MYTPVRSSIYCLLQDYQQVLDLMREIILATDLQHHFDILTALTSMAESKSSTILNSNTQKTSSSVNPI